MPFDDEKMRLESRLLGLLNQALQDRNRDEIVASTLALADLYLSGDLYEKAEEYFRRLLVAPLEALARPDEKARAHVHLGTIHLRRGQLGGGGESLRQAREIQAEDELVLLQARLLACELDLHAGRYREVVDAVEAVLGHESPDRLGDLRVEFLLLEGRARRLMGRYRLAERALGKALDVATKSAYEAGAAAAHSELGRLLTLCGRLKQAHEHLEAAMRSDQGTSSQRRLDTDRRRLALLLLRTGRWSDAETLLDQAYHSSRDLGLVDSRLAAQLVRANLRRLRGASEDAHDLALDAMEAARAAGFVRRQAQSQHVLALVALDRGQGREAILVLRAVEAMYGHLAPESNLMLQVHLGLGRAHDLQGEVPESFDRLMRASALARETGSDIERHVVDSCLGEHFRRRGEEEKAAELLTRAARELGTLGAKFDVARARLWLSRLLADARMARTLEDRHREIKLARSNLFEARRLFELMGAAPRVAECLELEGRLQPEKPAAKAE